MANRLLNDAMTRLARAWVAEADDAPILGMCKDCEAVMPQDMLCPNGGRGYLCPVCADKELALLRKRVAELETRPKRATKARRKPPVKRPA